MATLQLNGGGKLDFDDHGKGPAIVFLHGWSLGKEAFGKQLRELSNRYRVVVPDMRGHGNSKKFVNGDSIDTLAGDLERLLADRRFVYADVPYDIKPYNELLAVAWCGRGETEATVVQGEACPIPPRPKSGKEIRLTAFAACAG